MIPVALTVAGSDSGGGAGIQADLKTFADHGVFGTSAIAAITAQNSRGVTRVDPVPVEGLVAQLEAVFDDFEVRAVKIGMLGSMGHVRATATFLAALDPRPPVVLDPVMVASTGHRLLQSDAEAALRDELLPLATVATPNLEEASVLAGTDERDAILAWARARPTALLITGGDVVGDTITDVLFTGGVGREWTHRRRGDRAFHGTGCTTSSAIAARLAKGDELGAAIDGAIAYVQERIADADDHGSVGRGNPSLIHGRGRHPAWSGD
ncbi:MAG: bifunctional hydroxymethylpyrimidine kinase/phosphomethylpyrimidine kinase [Myxococcota bacterium]